MNSKDGKDYYLGIQREKEFGEDKSGNEWQKIVKTKDGRGHTHNQLQIIQEQTKARQNLIVDLDAYDEDDALVSLAQRHHHDSTHTSTLNWWEKAKPKRRSQS